MNFIKCSKDALNVSEVNDLVSHTDSSSDLLFVERNKIIMQSFDDETENDQFKNYFHHTCFEIRSKWKSILHIAIYKKIGLLNINEISFIVAVSSSSVSDAADVIQFAVNKIKSFDPSDFIDDTYGNIQYKNQNKLNHDLVEIDDVSPDLIQIKANNFEINRRIENFIQMKRTAINQRNIKEFVQINLMKASKQNISNENQCARVDAVLWKRSDSKSHLKIHKVVNEWGPQISKSSTNIDECISKHTSDLPISVNERITNCEKHVGVDRPLSSDIYARLKHIEDRILELDSISPEYSNFWKNDSAKLPQQIDKYTNFNKNIKFHTKTKYSMEDLHNKISEIKKKVKTDSSYHSDM